MTTKPETPKGNQPYVHAWLALLVLFVLGLAVSAYIHFAIYGYTLGPRTWGRSLGTILGGGLSLAALPAIVIVPWRLFQRRRGPTNTPITVGAFIFVIVAALILEGAAIPSSSNTAYILEGCEYSVEFPGDPNITTIHIPGLGDFPQAEYVGGSSERALYLRVECISLSKTQRDLFDNKKYLLDQAAAFAETNGLGSVEFQYEDTELGRLVTLRGYKRVSETPATYAVHMYLGRRSLLTMLAGGLSSHYPQVGVTEFFASARIADSKQAPEQALKVAVIDGDYRDVERELKNKKWSADDLGRALLAAAGKNKPMVAALLLTSGANPNYSVLYRSGVAIAASENNPEVLEVSFKRGWCGIGSIQGTYMAGS